MGGSILKERRPMIVAAHQPLYLPWLGYLHKIAHCDCFVIMDDLQFTRREFQNRNRVKCNHGARWLTVPIVRGGHEQPVHEKRIERASLPLGSRHHWQTKTWRTLEVHYGRSPHFDLYAQALNETYSRHWEWLLDLNLHLIFLLLDWFNIKTKILLGSSLNLKGRTTDRIVDLCRRLGAETYLSGSGGSRDYLSIDAFHRAGLKVSWQEFRHPVYPQRYPEVGFIPKLSALDALLNCGVESTEFLLGPQEVPPLDCAQGTHPCHRQGPNTKEAPTPASLSGSNTAPPEGTQQAPTPYGG